MSLVETVQDGSLVTAAGVSMVVGVIGFLSPCVLPLVPGYLSYVAGIAGDGMQPSQRRTFFGASLFVLGFTALLVTEGALFGQLGRSLRSHEDILQRVLGAVTILMGIAFLGGLRFLQRDLKFHRLPPMGLLGAPVLGFTFALAWTPCLTPTFTAIFGLSVSQGGTAGRGAFLMVFYCFGLGLPFIFMALGFGWVTGALGLVRRHRRAVGAFGGLLLVGIGVLLVSGEWNILMIELKTHVGSGNGFEV